MERSNFSTLNNLTIKQYMANGEIIIEPFNPNQLNTSSYDVTLGEYYYRPQLPQVDNMICNENIYDIWSKESVDKVWGDVKCAQTLEENGYDANKFNIGSTDKVIFIKPGETILAHTNEFIGGVNTVTTMMKARSSMGRSFITVCSCAGWGDVGYFTRWTMEIKNNSQYYTIPLVVNKPIAQIIFFETGEVEVGSSYNQTGHYQTESSLSELIKNWNPSSMLPKLYKN
jgi:dCTP deaminase